MNTATPLLPSARLSASAWATVIFAGLLLALPLAIFTSDLPQKILPPTSIESAYLPTPDLLPASPPAPSTVEVPATVPMILPPERTPPEIQIIEIPPGPQVVPHGPVAGIGWFPDFGGDSLLESLHELDNPPEALVQVAPSTNYRPRETMSVTAELVVEKDGSVSSVRIIASDHPQLATAAAAAAARWRFSPGMKDGRPVRFRLQQRFDFRP